ncbi:autorepressor SdpR family transcription factor [Gorillibacterium timonense]|uniref:autorepressor SdpR family transcription factor n=1 Tax=Gorillibacterium timonense TaxID=1689269 RepID=UPI00071D5542|nr:autorepressor SdpR family transcription factor [Gorillibacterium timonense]
MNESFKALADPTRRKIIDLLKEKDRTAGELAEYFQMSKPSLSHHLNSLKHAGLIQDEREGQFIRYTLNMTVLQEVLGWVLSVTGAGSEDKKAAPNKKKEDHPS